jgi:hypothetical protein
MRYPGRVRHQDPVHHTDAVRYSDPVRHQDPVHHSDAVRYSDPVRYPAHVRHSDPVRHPGPVRHYAPNVTPPSAQLAISSDHSIHLPITFCQTNHIKADIKMVKIDMKARKWSEPIGSQADFEKATLLRVRASGRQGAGATVAQDGASGRRQPDRPTRRPPPQEAPLPSRDSGQSPTMSLSRQISIVRVRKVYPRGKYPSLAETMK